jgi:hypothetical protein
VFGLLWLHLHALKSHECFWAHVWLLIIINTLFLVCLLNVLEGFRISCLCILYSNAIILIYARILGSFLISFRSISFSIMTSCFCPIGSLDLLIAFLLHLLKFLHLVIFCNLWSPIYCVSSMYSLLDTCISFHSYYDKCTPWERTHTILAF